MVRSMDIDKRFDISNTSGESDILIFSVDCVMGGWTEWSTCSKTSGTKTRSRDVIQEPMNNGIPCSKRNDTNYCPGWN